MSALTIEGNKRKTIFFSVSGALEEINALIDQAMFRRAPDDSIFFAFPISSKSKVRTRRNCQVSSTLPLLQHAHACDLLEPSSAQQCDDEREETAVLVPFKIGGSSFRLSRSHDSESTRSFSFLTDVENEEELSDDSSTDFKGVTTSKDIAEHAAANSNDNDRGKQQMYAECDGDQSLLNLRSDEFGEEVGDAHAKSVNDAFNGSDLALSRSRRYQTDGFLLLCDQSNSCTARRFAARPSKPSKSCKNLYSSGYPTSFAEYPSHNSHRNTKERSFSDHHATRSLAQHQKQHKNHGKGDQTDRLSREGCEVVSMHAQAAKTKLKPKPNTAISPPYLTAASLHSPRSPLRWRTVISLKPLNPSHVPKSQREMPASRSQSQRSRSSSRGSSGREGLITPSTSHEDAFYLQSRSSSRKARAGGTQKMVKTRRGYWALNPMQWLKHCRQEMQVVDMTSILDLKQDVPKHRSRSESFRYKSKDS